MSDRGGHGGAGEPTDQELMLRFSRGGDVESFDMLVRRRCGEVRAFFCRVLRGPDREKRAEALARETFARMIRDRNGYRKEEKFLTWMYSEAYDVLRDEYLRKGGSMRASGGLGGDGGEAADGLSGRLRRALESLPFEMRALVVLDFGNFQSYGIEKSCSSGSGFLPKL
ncbi:MAG: hypothetical protein N3A38_15520, partial [Planctomycetota bacterium]|nr:hypothetical protein [Planctomycetota bacterium]